MAIMRKILVTMMVLTGVHAFASSNPVYIRKNLGKTSGGTAPAAPVFSAPSGYNVSFTGLNGGFINAAGKNAAGFVLNWPEYSAGATYSYSITSAGGGSKTGSGSVTSASQTISGINLSSPNLNDGVVTLSVTLSQNSMTGNAATATATLDATAPTISSALGYASATTFAQGEVFSFDAVFSEAVQLGNLSNTALSMGIAISGAARSITNAPQYSTQTSPSFTYSPLPTSGNLANVTRLRYSYTVQSTDFGINNQVVMRAASGLTIPSGVTVRDAAGNSYVPFVTDITVANVIVAGAVPVLVSSTPAINATYESTNRNFTLEFNRPVDILTPSAIRLRKVSDNSNLTGNFTLLGGNGSKTIYLQYNQASGVSLVEAPAGTSLYLYMPPNSYRDANTLLAGTLFQDASTLSFVVGDTTAPTRTSVLANNPPAAITSGATGVSNSHDIWLSFSEPVSCPIGTSASNNFRVRRVSDNVVVFNGSTGYRTTSSGACTGVSAGLQVPASGSGNQTIFITANPGLYGFGVQYRIEYDAGAIMDIAGNQAAALSAFNYTTVVYPSCKAILDAGLSTGSGVYQIDPDGDGGADQIGIYCDMSTDGGGWTYVAKNWVGNSDTNRIAKAGLFQQSFTGNQGSITYAQTTAQLALPDSNTNKFPSLVPGADGSFRLTYDQINRLFQNGAQQVRYMKDGVSFVYFKVWRNPSTYNLANTMFSFTSANAGTMCTTGTSNCDFALYSSLSDLTGNSNRWQACSFGDIGFPLDCWTNSAGVNPNGYFKWFAISSATGAISGDQNPSRRMEIYVR